MSGKRDLERRKVVCGSREMVRAPQQYPRRGWTDLLVSRSRARFVAKVLVLLEFAVFKRDWPRPPLRPIDRAFWVAPSRIW